MISKDELLYFQEVAKTLNLSRASERLGISQPSLSGAIKRIEHTLEAPIFIRHKRGVLLTQAGKELLIHTKKLIQCWDEVKTRSQMVASEPQGDLTLGINTSIALYCLAGFLPELITKHSKLAIKLQHDISRKIVEAVMDFSIDVGIVVNPIRHPNLIIQKLFKDETTFWYAGNGEPSFNNKTTVLCNPELNQTQELLKKIQKRGGEYNKMISGSNLEVIANLCASGCGIGILPTTVAARYKKLKSIKNSPTYQDEICLIYRPENRDLVGIRALVLAIKNYFEKNI